MDFDRPQERAITQGLGKSRSPSKGTLQANRYGHLRMHAVEIIQACALHGMPSEDRLLTGAPERYHFLPTVSPKRTKGLTQKPENRRIGQVKGFCLPGVRRQTVTQLTRR